MNFHSLKELDIFGSEIRWRLLSKDTFKSFFGSFVTLSLIALIALKIYFFIIKVFDQGFVVNTETFRFNGENQFINMSNFKFFLFSDLHTSLENYNRTVGVNINPRDYFNISDFFDFSIYDFTSQEQTIKLNPLIVDCLSSEKFNFLNKNSSKEQSSFYKCIEMDQKQNFLNISKKNSYLRPKKNEVINIQRDTIYQTYVVINMKKNLIDYLKKTKETVNIYFILSNYRINPENYMIEEYYSSFYFPVNTDFVYQSELKFRKLSINKKIELDIFNFEYFEDNSFRFLDDSFRMITNLIDKNNSDENNDAYTSYIGLLLDTFEHNNEVILFTLDDLLAVIGGFMQLILSFAEIITGIYNDLIGEKLFSKFFWEKFCDYDKTLFYVRRNIDHQMRYYNFYTKNDYDINEKNDENFIENKKCKSVVNSKNLPKNDIQRKHHLIEEEHDIEKNIKTLDSAYSKNLYESNNKLLINDTNLNKKDVKTEFKNSSFSEVNIEDEYVNEERKIAERFKKFKTENNIQIINLKKDFESNDKIQSCLSSFDSQSIMKNKDENKNENYEEIVKISEERNREKRSKQ